MGNVFYYDKNTHIDEIKELHDKESKDSNWIHFKLTEDADYKIFCGKNKLGLYEITLNKKLECWEHRVMDFISYVNYGELNAILEISKHDLELCKKKYNGHSYKDTLLRKYESEVLIHSAPKKAWNSIKSDTCLKSWNILNKEGKVFEKNPIGNLLGDPDEFSDYVMLGSGTTCEIVVSSSDKKEINCDIECKYEPGVRMYFDAGKIASDGKLIRDGAHKKVKDELELEKYLLFIATAETIDVNEKDWTPRMFTERADEIFNEKYGLLSNNSI